MHDLLAEEELVSACVIIILNVKKKEDNEKDDGKEKEEIELMNKQESQKNSLQNEIKNAIYFHLIPQQQKEIFSLDMYDKKPTTNDIKLGRICMCEWISKFN